MDNLIESYRNATKKARHRAGGMTIVCIDDESLPENEYGSMGQRTIVPRSQKEGGIKGYTSVKEKKFGSGVKHRNVSMDEHGGTQILSEEENFIPDLFDKPPPPAEPAPAPAPAATGDIMDIMTSTPEPMSKQAAEQAKPSEMMQMMQMMMQMSGQNGNGHAKKVTEPEPAPEPKAPERSVQVTFSGDFGRFRAQYAEARVEDGFVLLVTGSGQSSMYEPPVSPAVPIGVSFEGKSEKVLNVGLSFEYKGDILLIMPIKANSPDSAND